jgi:hypothetical protein
VHRSAERNLGEGNRVAGTNIGARSAHHVVALLQALRVQDVALLAIRVLNQRDVGRAVGIVFDFGNLARHAMFVALEVNATIQALGAAATTA